SIRSNTRSLAACSTRSDASRRWPKCANSARKPPDRSGSGEIGEAGGRFERCQPALARALGFEIPAPEFGLPVLLAVGGREQFARVGARFDGGESHGQ